MASIANDPNGRRRLIFKAPDGRRRTIRLGKVSKKAAGLIRSRVEAIVSARIACQPLDPDTTAWVASLSDDMHNKLAETGLFERRGVAKLGSFLRSILDERKDLKPNTRRNWQSAIGHLIAFFGDEANLRDVTPGEADRFRQWMINEGLGESTVSREVKRARQFFRVADRRRLIAENPFADIATPAQVNPDRQHYVTLENTRLLLDECRSPLQRLTIALARFAGLRIPSELVSLLWSEVNWERERFIVRAPKTERHGRGTRVVPIFPELAPFLREAWEAAPEGEDRIFPDITPKSNRRTWLGKLAARAGVELWEKPWVNMRASAVTDAADKFPGHVCEAWFGHSEAIANRHYRQVTEEHFQKAIAPDGKPADAPTLGNATGQREKPTDRTQPGRDDTRDRTPGGAKSGAREDEKAAQNPARYPALPNPTESQETQKALGNKGLERSSKTECNPMELHQYPLGESNPCLRTENPMSWATRRRGRWAASTSSSGSLLPVSHRVNRAGRASTGGLARGGKAWPRRIAKRHRLRWDGTVRPSNRIEPVTPEKGTPRFGCRP